MRITTWNVNGLRKLAPLPPVFNTLQSDIICLQETRISSLSDPELESLAFVPGYHSFFSVCTTRSGYSGVATFCRKSVATPHSAHEGLNDPSLPPSLPLQGPCDAPSSNCPCPQGYSSHTLTQVRDEGRCLITDHGHFVLVNVYIPAVSVDGRDAFKLAFLHALRAKIDLFRHAGRRVVVVGDFNICPAPIDSADRLCLQRDPVWDLQPSRRWLSRLLSPTQGDMLDVFRQSHPTRRHAYTCWSESLRGRDTNHGVRIDLILIHRALLSPSSPAADISSHVMGSDHCPVFLDLTVPHRPAHLPVHPPQFCTQLLPRFTKRQQTISHFFTCPTTNLKPHTVSPLTLTKKPILTIHKLHRAQLTAAAAARKSTRKQKPKRKQNDRVQLKLTTLNAIPPSTPEDAITRISPQSQTNDVQQSRNFTSRAPTPTPTQSREVASTQWRKLLSGPPPPPLCRHHKPCVLKKVTKTGENKGKTFFSCAYPHGSGPNSNCNFFKWAPYDSRLPTAPLP